MSRSLISERLHQLVTILSATRRQRQPRPAVRRFPGVESLEGRALMAGLSASGVLSSVAAGANYDYTVRLTDTSSTTPIGTFWYAWVPDENFLATGPPALSANPPSGWSDQITHGGSSDGYAIQFTANSPADDIQPGGSMNFGFTSTDAPAAVNGNSVPHPGTPVGTSFVYPGAPLTPGGVQFTVAPAPTSTPTPTPLVSVSNVQIERNRKHMVTEVIVSFSGGLNVSEADSLGVYRLATPGKKGSFTAKNAKVLKLKSAAYTGTSTIWTVTLTPKKAFALTTPVQLVVNGQSLQDSDGNSIDGANDGVAGSNFVTIINHNTPVVAGTPTPAPAPSPTPVY